MCPAHSHPLDPYKATQARYFCALFTRGKELTRSPSRSEGRTRNQPRRLCKGLFLCPLPPPPRNGVWGSLHVPPSTETRGPQRQETGGPVLTRPAQPLTGSQRTVEPSFTFIPENHSRHPSRPRSGIGRRHLTCAQGLHWLAPPQPSGLRSNVASSANPV